LLINLFIDTKDIRNLQGSMMLEVDIRFFQKASSCKDRITL